MNTQALGIWACLAFAGGTLVTTGDNEALAQEGAMGIEEITVTARRREESLMETPVSITAFTGDALKAQNIDQLDQIAQATPGLVFDRTTGVNSHSSRIIIRGVGQVEWAPTKQTGVGLYVDGVYVAQNAGSLIDMADIESVEVLRGPQGTLFGRNTIGGAIQVNTIKPSDELDGDVELLVGRFDRMRVKGSVNIPFSDTFYGRISGLFDEREGYIDTPNIPDDDGLGANDVNAARIALRWLPSDALTIDFAADFTNQQSNGTPRVLGSTVNNSTFPRPTNAADWNLNVAPLLGGPLFEDSAYLGPETYTSLAGTLSEVDSDIKGFNLTIQWDFGNNISLKSISSYRDVDIQAFGDQDQSPGFAFQSADNNVGDVLSQEFQLSGTALDDRIIWVAGFYYYTEENLNQNIVEFPSFHLLSGSKIDNKSQAVFSQFTYDATDRLSITLGGRYTDEDLNSIADDDTSFLLSWFCPGGPPPVCFPQGPGFVGYVPVPAPPAPGSQRIIPNDTVFSSDQEKFEPYLNLAYDFTDNLMGYVSYSEGFKGGGFTQRIPPGGTIAAFEPEFASVYEVGAKWSTDRIALSGSWFYNDYTDLQVLTVRQLGGTTENAADAVIQGGELELLAGVTDRFTITLGLSLLDGEYKNVDPAVAFSESNFIPFLTDWQVNASASYVFPLSTGDLVGRLDYFRTADYYSDADNLPEFHFDDYGLLNVSLTYIHASEKWELALQARNVLDEYYKTSGSQTFLRNGWTQHVVGPPAQWSLRFGYNF